MNTNVHYVTNLEESVWKHKALTWANQFPFVCFLDGNGYSSFPNGCFRKVLAVASKNIQLSENQIFNQLEQKPSDAWWFGYLSYDLKNELFELVSNGKNFLDFPLASFFQAEIVLEWDALGQVRILGENADSIYEQILATKPIELGQIEQPLITDYQTKADYISTIEAIQNGIREGHVYELNYCLQFACSSAISGLKSYLKLMEFSPAPFSGWFKAGALEIVSGSPERYLKKAGNRLISQPIKGTAPRKSDPKEDETEKRNLLNSPKERAENLMIVDLVRNDLSRISVPGTTTVSELFGIYSFPQVHQMISTVESELRPNLTWLDAIRSSFPMGSMTGAPKLEVMKWIDRLETHQRGAFSGALGYISPDNDFDFNVLIRSLFINHERNKSGFSVGSAITIDSEPQAEWEECQVKAKAIFKLLGAAVN